MIFVNSSLFFRRKQITLDSWRLRKIFLRMEGIASIKLNTNTKKYRVGFCWKNFDFNHYKTIVYLPQKRNYSLYNMVLVS